MSEPASDERAPGPGRGVQPRPGRRAPRQAATVILLRGGAEALEVLLVRRTPKARFMGGVWVFPGGAVDARRGRRRRGPPRGGDPRAARGGGDRARRPRRAREVLALDHARRRCRSASTPTSSSRRCPTGRSRGRRRGVRRPRLVHARRRRSTPTRAEEIAARLPDDQAPRAAERVRLGRRAARATRAGATCSRSSRGSCSRARSPAILLPGEPGY